MTTADLQDLARAMPASARRLVEEAIELLLLACDEMDGDPNLEDDGTAEPDEDREPSLGWTEGEAADGCRPVLLGAADLEQDMGDEPELEEAI